MDPVTTTPNYALDPPSPATHLSVALHKKKNRARMQKEEVKGLVASQPLRNINARHKHRRVIADMAREEKEECE